MHERAKKGREFGVVLLILATVVVLQLMISYGPLWGIGKETSCAQRSAKPPHEATALL